MPLGQTILVLAPHTDDAELGCGGTIARAVEEGRRVCVAAFSTAKASLPEGAPPDTLKREFLAAMPVLGISEDDVFVFDFPVRRLSYHRQEVLEEIVALRRRLEPDTVLLPSGHDHHQDHEVVADEGLRAFNNCSVLGYELPWNQIRFDAQAFVTLDERHVQRKWDALQAYETQFALQRSYFTRDFIFGLARVRGTQIRTDWAEAFEALRVKF